jgi:rubredoxin
MPYNPDSGGNDSEGWRVMERYQCPECSYIYDEQVGDEEEGYPPGTLWSEVEEDFFCPDCGIFPKYEFEPLT